MNIRKYAGLVGIAALVLTMGQQVAHADTTVTIRPGQLDTSETRTAGHVDFRRDGLHVYTDDNSSQAKAAGYFALDSGIPDSASLVWHGTQPQPGQQLVFDADSTSGNNDYNILVGEPIYGDDWWLTGSSSADAHAVCPQTGGGFGSDCHGTLAEWQAALPNAHAYAGGFSLGSGVLGDGVIDSITYGDTHYVFTSDPALTPADVTGSSHKTVQARHYVKRLELTFVSDQAPPNSTLGNKLVWVVKVDGHRTARIAQGFDSTDQVARRFSYHTGPHFVVVKKNGEVVRSFIIRTGPVR